MKKLFAITTLFFALVQLSSAQFDETLQPKSFKLSLKPLAPVVLPDFIMSAAEQADITEAKNGDLPKFSRSVYTTINLTNSGTWSQLANGDRIWRVQVTSKDALGLIPLFDKLYLPPGATLHVYMPGREEILGAFTNANTPEPRAFCSGLIHGETCILEYFEPAAQQNQGILSLNEVGHAYRWVTPLKDANGTSAAGSCEVNVKCSEADNWADQVRAVARILVIATSGQGYCSGTLINNARQDCTPYLLSAQHCSEGATAQQYAQWVFYFNYQASACAGTTGPQNKQVNGCTKIADSNDNGGDTGSDFLLLHLNSAPSAAYNVYYAGWNNTSTASTSGVCIHHPDGDIKKISTYTQTVTSTSWGGSVQNTHWEVKWAATTNGHGVTEPGSSGSALFNPQGLIVGTLTGGNSYCTSPNVPDQFGKLAYDWVSNGTADNLRLKPWLDPDNTGITNLAGTNPPCGSAVQNDAGIQLIEVPDGSLCSDTISPSLVLRNYGGNTLQSVIINYQIDGNVYQYNYNGNLAAGGTITLNLGNYVLGPGNHTFIAETVAPNGTTDNNTANDTKTNAFVIVPPAGNLNLYIKTDSYGSETSWDIKNNSGTVVTSGGPFGDVAGGEVINTSVCLTPGCYTLNLYDSYGDGMAVGGNAAMTLAGPNGTPNYATLVTKNFGTEVNFSFCVAGATGITALNKQNVTVTPNPSAGLFNVSFDTDETKTVRVFDAVGKLISEQKVNAKNCALNLAGSSKGIYVLQVESTGSIATQKLIVE